MDELRSLSRDLFGRYQVLHKVIWVTFDVTKELIVSLNLEHHLTMDIFDVEVFTGNKESATSSCIEGESASSYLVDTE